MTDPNRYKRGSEFSNVSKTWEENEKHAGESPEERLDEHSGPQHGSQDYWARTNDEDIQEEEEKG